MTIQEIGESGIESNIVISFLTFAHGNVMKNVTFHKKIRQIRFSDKEYIAEVNACYSLKVKKLKSIETGIRRNKISKEYLSKTKLNIFGCLI